MANKQLYTLLSIVKNNGDSKRLLRLGMDYRQIGELTKDAIFHKLIDFEQDKLIITKYGEHLLTQLSEEFKIIDKEKWIEPENASRIPVLSKDFIFLPNQNELHFN